MHHSLGSRVHIPQRLLFVTSDMPSLTCLTAILAPAMKSPLAFFGGRHLFSFLNFLIFFSLFFFVPHVRISSLALVDTDFITRMLRGVVKQRRGNRGQTSANMPQGGDQFDELSI